MLWLQKSPILPGRDPVLETMKLRGIPLTRERYLITAGLEEPLSAELEADLPREFRLHPGPVF